MPYTFSMAEFADNLKSMRKARGLTQKELAEAIGVGQTAIANYEQGNRSPDTEGLVKLSDYLEVSVDELLGKEGGGLFRHQNAGFGPFGASDKDVYVETDPVIRGEDPPLQIYRSNTDVNFADEVDRFLALAVKGQPMVSINRVSELAVLGCEVNDIYRLILEPVLYRTGEMWANGEIKIHQEHNISQSIMSCMGLLRNFMVRNASKGKRFIGVVVNGEMHGIGLNMVSDYLFMEGWDVMSLGTYLPGPEAAGAIQTYRPDVVGISVTMSYNLNAAEQLISILKDAPADERPLILVGGQAFASEPGLWQRIKADAFAQRGVEAVAMLDRMIK